MGWAVEHWTFSSCWASETPTEALVVWDLCHCDVVLLRFFLGSRLQVISEVACGIESLSMMRLVLLLLLSNVAADNCQCPGLCSCAEGQCTWPMYCSCHCDASSPSCHCTPGTPFAPVQLQRGEVTAGSNGGCHAPCTDSFDCISGFVCGGEGVCCNGVTGASCPCPGGVLQV